MAFCQWPFRFIHLSINAFVCCLMAPYVRTSKVKLWIQCDSSHYLKIPNILFSLFALLSLRRIVAKNFFFSNLDITNRQFWLTFTEDYISTEMASNVLTQTFQINCHNGISLGEESDNESWQLFVQYQLTHSNWHCNSLSKFLCHSFILLIYFTRQWFFVYISTFAESFHSYLNEKLFRVCSLLVIWCDIRYFMYCTN